MLKKGKLHYTVNNEKRINECLKSLKLSGTWSVEQHEKIQTPSSRPDFLHSLCKLYTKVENKYHPFRSILSAIGTLSYKKEQFLVPRIDSITCNKFTVKNTFWFAKKQLNKKVLWLWVV